MLYTDEFIESLRLDPINGLIGICEKAITRVHEHPSWRDEDVAAIVETYALIAEVIDSGLVPQNIEYTKVSTITKGNCPQIYEYISHLHGRLKAELSKLELEALRTRFRVSLGSSFSYEFSQGDLERVQTLVNELRKLIANAEDLEKDHQQRLLKRLEKLQSELHKKVSDLDRFWGLMGDAGVALGKLGNDAKPIVDRIRELTQIVWQTQSRAEELPSGTQIPSLGHDSLPGGDDI